MYEILFLLSFLSLYDSIFSFQGNFKISQFTRLYLTYSLIKIIENPQQIFRKFAILSSQVGFFWMRRLYNHSFYEWKVILLYLIGESFGSLFKFHSKSLFECNAISQIQEIVLNWEKHLAMMTEMRSCILAKYVLQ